MEHPEVPSWLRGCWQRSWIQFADGTRNDTDTVVWLQTAGVMADVRISGDRPSFAGVDGLADCSPEQLAALARSIASTGHTRVSAEHESDEGVHTCVAEWFTYGYGANFQPACTFPEPGRLEVDADGRVMIERAPSGAYVEEWRLVPGSADELRHELLVDGRELFVAGPVAVLLRDRATPMQPGDEFTLERLDCEFSVAHRDDDGIYRITASTLPWREGVPLDAPV